jgi:hypothetical protein
LKNNFRQVKPKQIFALVVFVFFVTGAFAQTSAQTLVEEYKDSLNHLAHVMQRGENDSSRFAASSVYYSIVNFILADSSSFTASFDSVPNLSVKTSPDHTFRLYTWVTSNYAGSEYRYFGILQTQNSSASKVRGQRGKKINLFPLNDSTEVIDKPLSRKLKADHWYGAIYYSIIADERKGKKYYTLLGWKGKNETLTQKVIDVLSFENGKPVFGLPVFKWNNIYNHRVIFEFTSQAVMSLKYAEAKKILVFDHIGKSTLTGVIGPDGTYDAFKYVKDHWEFEPDVDVDNGFTPRTKSVKLFKDDELKKEEK